MAGAASVGTVRRSAGARPRGNWTYQFAAVVDDWLQGVTLVIRGDDLLESTGRQLQLARLLGRTEPPDFLHHPLIMKSATQKFSKSNHDTGIRDLRASGWTADQTIERQRSSPVWPIELGQTDSINCCTALLKPLAALFRSRDHSRPAGSLV